MVLKGVASCDHPGKALVNRGMPTRLPSTMSSVYAATAPEWLQTIRTLPVGTELAFWQPTPAEPKRMAVGERWYFKERGRALICGFGLFKRWETGSLEALFQRYGSATGYPTAHELARGIRALREDASLATTVGNIV